MADGRADGAAPIASDLDNTEIDVSSVTGATKLDLGSVAGLEISVSEGGQVLTIVGDEERIPAELRDPKKVLTVSWGGELVTFGEVEELDTGLGSFFAQLQLIYRRLESAAEAAADKDPKPDEAAAAGGARELNLMNEAAVERLIEYGESTWARAAPEVEGELFRVTDGKEPLFTSTHPVSLVGSGDAADHPKRAREAPAGPATSVAAPLARVLLCQTPSPAAEPTIGRSP